MEKTVAPGAGYSRPGCDQCAHCGVQMGIGTTVNFVCRYNPPKVIAQLVPGPEGLAWQGMSFWPIVAKTDWCAKFEPEKH